MLGFLTGVTSWYTTAKTVYDQFETVIDGFDSGQDQYYGDGSNTNTGGTNQDTSNKVNSRRFKSYFGWIKLNQVLGLV